MVIVSSIKSHLIKISGLQYTPSKVYHCIRDAVSRAGGLTSSLLRSTGWRSLTFMFSLLTSDFCPTVEFASSSWNTGFVRNLKLLEPVLHRWTKQSTGLVELSYPERLSWLNLFSVKGRLLCADLILCYKILQGINIIAPLDVFTLSPHSGIIGHQFKILR